MVGNTDINQVFRARDGSATSSVGSPGAALRNQRESHLTGGVNHFKS